METKRLFCLKNKNIFLPLKAGNRTLAIFWYSKAKLKDYSTLSWWRSLSCRNQSIVYFCKSMDWFLYDRDLGHESVNITDSDESRKLIHFKKLVTNIPSHWNHSTEENDCSLFENLLDKQIYSDKFVEKFNFLKCQGC